MRWKLVSSSISGWSVIIWGSPNAAASLSDEVSLLQSKESLKCSDLSGKLLAGKMVKNWLNLSLSSFYRKSQLLEDLYRANFNLGNIYFRNGQKSNAVRCLEQAKECARKIKEKFSESECFHCIGKAWKLCIQKPIPEYHSARLVRFPPLCSNVELIVCLYRFCTGSVVSGWFCGS